MVRVLRVTSISLVVFIFLLPYTSSGDVIHDGSSITTNTNSRLSRLDFPPGFIFGAGSSAYQVEGAAAEDGRKPSIWDTFTHQGKTADKGTGDIAADQYHKYKDDVKLMHDMGLDAYRFSISWSRIIPDGHGSVNLKGVSYYNNLINELVSYGIEAHVTLSHFDIPQTLQDEYEGQLGRKFIGDFTVYADVCFQEFGDRVKSWMTFNEPNIQTFTGNDIGMMPPGRCSYPFGVNCSVGDSTTEPYLAAHNILLAHAEAVHLYRTKYQEKQKGQIGITLLGFWIEPLTNSSQNIAASQRIRDFHLGWFLDPLVYGKYPAIMRKIVGSRLPFFTKNESKRLKGSFDFIGLNHYCALYVQDLPRTSDEYGSDYTRDISIKISRLPTTEDGSTNPASRNDTIRIEYIKTYIASLLPSIRNGTNVRGYFVWSFIDVFEAAGGYHSHFGLYEVDFGDAELRRYPRQSVYWYSDFLAKTGRNIGTSSYL
ncbi:beta-glucosidase [Ranunculus cassubicifolius]